MKCLNCNAEIQEGMNFCPVCGATAPAKPEMESNEPLSNNETQVVEPQPQQPVQPQQPPVQPQQQPPVQSQQQPPVQPQQPPVQPQQQMRYNQPYQQPNPYQPAPQKSGNVKWIVIGFLGALLISLAGFLAWMFLNKDKAEEKSTPSTVTQTTDEKKEKPANTAVDTKSNEVKPNADEVAPTADPETVVVEKVVETVVEKPVIVEKPVSSHRHSRSYAAGAGLWPETSTRYLDPSELYGLSSWEKKIMRNEIYARHGYIFQTTDMKNYFNAQPWYSPRTRNVKLSKIESYNVQLIKSVE